MKVLLHPSGVTSPDSASYRHRSHTGPKRCGVLSYNVLQNNVSCPVKRYICITLYYILPTYAFDRFSLREFSRHTVSAPPSRYCYAAFHTVPLLAPCFLYYVSVVFWPIVTCYHRLVRQLKHLKRCRADLISKKDVCWQAQKPAQAHSQSSLRCIP